MTAEKGFAINDGIRRIADGVLGLLYPDSLYCVCCGNLIDDTRTYSLCDHCVRHIMWDRSPAKEKNGVRMMRCAAYGIYERTLIFSVKYNGKRYIARKIAEMMADKLRLLREAGAYDAAVPVPMFREKERKRGFNQAALIAKYLAKELGIGFVRDALIRTRDTRPMRGLSPDERAENVSGVFCLNERYASGREAAALRGKRILLIDDFYTTGATARECVRALSGAKPSDAVFYAFAAR